MRCLLSQCSCALIDIGKLLCAVDVRLPFNVEELLQDMFLVLASVFIVILSCPFLTMLLLLLAVVFAFLQRIACVVAREVVNQSHHFDYWSVILVCCKQFNPYLSSRSFRLMWQQLLFLSHTCLHEVFLKLSSSSCTLRKSIDLLLFHLFLEHHRTQLCFSSLKITHQSVQSIRYALLYLWNLTCCHFISLSRFTLLHFHIFSSIPVRHLPSLRVQVLPFLTRLSLAYWTNVT